jgi:putative oxidoreductase
MIPERYAPYTLALMRMVFGFLITFHGMQKIFGAYGGPTQPWVSLRGVAGPLELVGGTLVMIGLFTRPIAFLLSGEMAIAFFVQHFPRGGWPILGGGEPAVMNCFAFLSICTRGAGAWALDNLWYRRS